MPGPKKKRPVAGPMPDLPEAEPRDPEEVRAELRVLAREHLADLAWFKERFPWL